MGAPSRPKRISVVERASLSYIAAITAVSLEREDYINALEAFRRFLTPDLYWLDGVLGRQAPFRYYGEQFREKYGPCLFLARRGLVVFDGWGKAMPSFAMMREGEWVVFRHCFEELSGSPMIEAISSEGVLDAFLKAPSQFPIPFVTSDGIANITKEFPELVDLISHLRFTLLLGAMRETAAEAAEERMERLRVVMSNLEALGQFCQALDHVAYGEPPKLQSFSVFEEHVRDDHKGTSRVTPEFLVRKLAEERIRKPTRGSDREYVQESNMTLKSLAQVFVPLSWLLREIEEKPQSRYHKRPPLAEEEKSVVRDLLARVRELPRKYLEALRSR